MWNTDAEAIIKLARVDGLARNTVLAMAAFHLRHQPPAVSQHRIAELYHLGSSLQDYQKTIKTSPEKLGQDGVNRLLFSGLLLNVIAFALPESHGEGDDADPGTSWVFLPREDRLGWLALYAGLRVLSKSMHAYMEQSLVFLGPIFFGGTGLGHEERRRIRDNARVVGKLLSARLYRQ